MRKYLLFLIVCVISISQSAQQNVKIKKKDRRRDIELTTTEGTIILRLFDSTPLHRDNFSDKELDLIERVRLHGYKLPQTHSEIYRTIGGTPQLDQNYTVFGEVVSGFDVVDKIALAPTSKGEDRDRPLQDVRIIKAKLIGRKNY